MIYSFCYNSGKVVHVPAMKVCGGLKGQLHLVLTSALYGGEWSATAESALPLRKEQLVCVKYESGWAPELVWMFWKDINILVLPGINPQFLRCPAYSLVTIWTKLAQLHILLKYLMKYSLAVNVLNSSWNVTCFGWTAQRFTVKNVALFWVVTLIHISFKAFVVPPQGGLPK